MIVESCLTGRQEVINSKLIDKVECGADITVITFNDGERLFVDEHYNKFMQRWKGTMIKDMKCGEKGIIRTSGRKIMKVDCGFIFLDNGSVVVGTFDSRVEIQVRMEI